MIDLQKALDVSLEAAAVADAIMMEKYRGTYQTYTKDNARGKAESILTEVDLLCDKAIVAKLEKHFPSTVVVSEESYQELAEGWHENSWVWYVDPIDGTLSYTEGSDSFGVSIALTYNGKPVLGVVTNPVMGATAYGAEGIGAFINGSPMKFEDNLNGKPHLLLSVGQDKSKSYNMARKHLGEIDLTLRRSVVTKAILLLQQQGDVYFTLPYEVFKGGQPNAWDLAGAAAIVSAAGGHSSDAFGNPLLFKGPGVSWPKGHIYCHPDRAEWALAKLQQAIEFRKNLD